MLKNNSKFKRFFNKSKEEKISEITKYLAEDESTSDSINFRSDDMSTQSLTNSISTQNLQTSSSDNMSTQPLTNSNSTQNLQTSNSESIQIISNSETSINSSSNSSIKKPQKPFIGKFELKTNNSEISFSITEQRTNRISNLIKRNLDSELNKEVNVDIELYKIIDSKFKFTTTNNYTLTENNIKNIIKNMKDFLKQY